MTAQPRGDEDLLDDLKRHEGFRAHPYHDTVGKLTIGYGRNLDDVGITEAEAEALLRNDVAKVRRQLDQHIPWWRSLSANRRRALINMAFNMGIGGLLSFQRMLRAMREGDFINAAEEALDSKWARQVGGRAGEVAGLIQKG